MASSRADESAEESEAEAAVDKFNHTDAIVDALVADDVAAFEALEPPLSVPLFPPVDQPQTSRGRYYGCCCGGGCCCTPKASPPRPCLPLHLAIQLRAIRIFTAALDAQPEQLSVREPDGDTLLHTLARCGPQLPVKASKPMEDAAMRALAKDGQLARQLLLTEDACGLRPLEACIKFGAFRLARRLFHLPGYLMKRRWRDRGWETRRYGIGEYDLLHGERRWLSPPVLLTYVCQNQLPALKASKLAKDPLMRAWYHRMTQQTRWIRLCRLLVASLPTLLFLTTILNREAQKMVSSFCIVVHCNRATYTAAAAAGFSYEYLSHNLSLFYATFLNLQVKGIPCIELRQAFIANKRILISVLALNSFTLLAKILFRVSQRSRVHRAFLQRQEAPGERFIQQTQFDLFHASCIISGASLLTIADQVFGTPFWYRALFPANGWLGLNLEQVIFGSTGILIICNLLYFGQYLEVMSKSTGKLFFTFQRMNSSSRTVMPLLFYWLVMFSLVFYCVVNTDDFSSSSVSLYATVKASLNMVTFPVENTMGVAFHVLFFMFVGINLLNFLIAFVNETFLECNADFELAYWLLRLYDCTKTFGYFEWLFRLPHWLELRRSKSCRGDGPIDITQPFFKRFKYMKVH